MTSKRYRWWHGVAFFVAVHIASRALRSSARKLAGKPSPQLGEDERRLYKTERLPRFAPPTVAFPIAWTVNSVSLIAGALHVLNLPVGSRGRTEFLRLQSAAWALYISFEAAYFGLESPLNAAAVTSLYSLATFASLQVARRKMHDKRAALSLAPTAAWLALANPVGLTQAAWNYDPFWNAGPLTVPPQKWLKPPTEPAPNIPATVATIAQGTIIPAIS